MKPSAFIGSSKESLDVARQLMRALASVVNCTIWDDGFFALNDGAFDLLLKKSALYDAGIILLTKDDTSLIRGKKKITPRDNTIFEAGLFYGRLGKGRTFLVVEDGVKLPSDLIGITVLYFKKGRGGRRNNIRTIAAKLIQEIKDSFARHHFGLLPSTALAVGYFYNFVKPMAMEIARNSKVKDCSTGKVYFIDKLSVLIPCDKALDVCSLMATKSRAYRWHEGHVLRDGNRNFNVKFSIKSGKAIINDIPSTLTVVGLVVDKIFSDGSLGINDNVKVAMMRELENFEHAIKDLVQNDDSVRPYVAIEMDSATSGFQHELSEADIRQPYLRNKC